MEKTARNRDKLIIAVRAIGKKLCEEAEDIVGSDELITGLKIHADLDLHSNDGIFFPEVQIECQHIVPVEDPEWFKV